MARSRRKNPFVGHTTAVSEKWDKRKANRALRRRVHMGKHDTLLREVSNVYMFHKDGLMRIDPAKHPDLMRK